MMRIHKALLDKIQAHAASSPEECCGFVFGHDKEAGRVVTETMAVANAEQNDKRLRFRIAPKDYLFAEQFAEQKQMQLLGVYHSHPEHSAVPSKHDSQAAFPYFSYLIVSVLGGRVDDVQSWRLSDEGHFENEPIHITDSF
ncbi:M67 family metallopeptidase [Hymenobacter tibetensis]|uniref:M67 family metallopeptidase n=1 Tax=Hymenobacter tibetensis TaxID=497967 RepID=A0ABY4CYX8_9BACT|nr:M67 family metallopeptidase [Hymenobacter tibetensis]UOG75262.1 M67 family metallopeptidase [Hymenobacter tibetensis]